MSDIVREGRLKFVSMCQDTMVDFLNYMRNPPGFIALPQLDELPKDAFVVAAMVNHEYRTIDFIVASAEFEPVPQGQRIERTSDVGIEWKVIPFSEIAGAAPEVGG